MEKFNTDITVDIHDVDFNGVARASSLMKYIQSAAQLQLTINGKSYDRLKEQNRAFILSRIKMELSEEVRAFDKLNVQTFPCTSRGFTFLRCYQLKKDGRVIGRAVSAWALVDTQSHALVRVNDFDLDLELYDSLDMSMSRIIIPCPLAEVGKYKVTYSDIDQNFHMNNTRYPDMYANFLPIENRRIESINISYQKEAPAGEVLTVFRGYSDGIYYIRTVREDGLVNTEAEIMLADLKNKA